MSARRIASNAAFTLLGNVVGIAGQLVLVPMFLRSWGDKLYGDWLTISAVTAYFSMADLGMQMYVVNRLTREQFEGRQREFAKTFQSTLLVYASVCGTGVVGLAGAVLVVPWSRWMSGREMTGAESAVLVAALGAGVLASLCGGFISSLYRAFGEPQKSSAFGASYRAIQLSLSVALLLARARPVAYGLAQVGLPLFFLIFVAADVRRRHSNVRYSLSEASWARARELLVPSLLFVLLPLANGLSIQGTLLVTSAVLGSAAVTVQSTTRTLTNALRQGLGILTNVIWPELTRLQAEGSNQRLRLAHSILVKASSVGTATGCAALMVLGPALHHWWTRGRTEMDVTFFQVLLIREILLTPSMSSSTLLAATNNHRGLSIVYVVQGALGVVGALLLIPSIGLPGIGWALLVADLLSFWFVVPVWSQRVVGQPAMAFFTGIYGPFILIIGAALAVSITCDHLTAPGVSRWLAVLGGTLATGGIGGWIWLEADERDLLRGAIAGLRPRGGAVARGDAAA